MKSAKQIDAEIRKGKFKPRALAEETGLARNTPIRGEKEADGYWHVRLLTHQVTGMHYRTPQFNLALLQWFANEQNRIESSNYNGPKYEIRFETGSGELIKFDVDEEIDPDQLRERLLLPQR